MVAKKSSRFESPHPLRMFPTFVWKSELLPEIHQSLNRRIITTLNELRRSVPALVPGQAWQSNQALHRLDEFRPLVACVMEAAEAALGYLKIDDDAIEITGCWANVNAPGAGHRMHSHPNNFLSGVYYVKTQAGADTVNFHDPRVQTDIMRPPVTELTADNTDQVVVKVSNGTLLVFPSWLQHSVDANRSDAERISVSFNIMFPSYGDRMSKPLWEPE
jgi:uncharacterized protein (TIGR02466 family)